MTDFAEKVKKYLELDGDGHARYNLEGAEDDLKVLHKSLKDSNPGQARSLAVCLITINRVINQLSQIEYLLEEKGAD